MTTIDLKKRTQQLQTAVGELIDDALRDGMLPRAIVEVLILEAEGAFDRKRDIEQEQSK